MADVDAATGRQATVVALYGDGKPAALRSLVLDLQARVTRAVGDRFVPRPAHDVHATVVGLERDGIDVAGLCGHLGRDLAAAPLTVQFGGFADRDHGLESRGLRLFERTLTVVADKVVLVGWPVDGNDEPTDRLDRIRRAAAGFGARHRYHETPESRDPDAYMVIGDLRPGADADRLDHCVRESRAELARTRCRVRVAAADVQLVTYVDPRLPAGSTTAVTDLS